MYLLTFASSYKPIFMVGSLDYKLRTNEEERTIEQEWEQRPEIERFGGSISKLASDEHHDEGYPQDQASQVQRSPNQGLFQGQ